MSEAQSQPPGATLWFVYMVRCADQTLYTGITTDLERRLAEHNGAGAARYTRARQPVRLVYREPAPDRAQAARREWALKQLSRRAKEALIAGAAPLPEGA